MMTWEEAVIWLRSQPDQEQLVRDCFYDDPLLDAARRYYASDEWKAIRKFLPKTRGRALDLGAGRGISSYALANDGWIVTALEPDRSPIVGSAAIRNLAAEAGVDITVAEDWGERLPFGDETFDLVFGRQVLHHARDLGTLCSEAHRVLKPGGLFMAVREHVIRRREDLQIFLDSHPLHRLYGGENAYLLGEYTSAIEGTDIQLLCVLNPLESDINLSPDSKAAFKARLAEKLKLPWPHLIPDKALALLGSFLRLPGGLFSFVGRRPA